MGAVLFCACSFNGSPPSGNPDAAISADAPIDVTAAIDAADPDAAQPVTRSFRSGEAGYDETHDTYVDSTASDSEFGDDTTLEWDFNGMMDAKLVLLRFGSIIGSNVDQIPQGAVIDSATLTGDVFDGSNGEASRMYRVLVQWDEDTTFSEFAEDGVINGTEFDDTVFIDGPRDLGAFSVDVTTVVQGWVNDPTTNNGWLFFPRSADRVRVRSSEGATVTDRPRLQVTFTP